MIGCYRLAEEEQKCVCSSVYFCSFLLYNIFIAVKEVRMCRIRAVFRDCLTLNNT